MAKYPDLEPADIQQAPRYAAWAAEDGLTTPAEASAEELIRRLLT
jgi:hypothetical protein